MRHDHTPQHVNGAFVGVAALGFVVGCTVVGLIAGLCFEGYIRVVVPW